MNSKKKQYRLLIKIPDNSQHPIFQDGKTLIPCMWIEVNEINLGSVNKPNPKIHGFKYLPIIGDDLQ